MYHTALSLPRSLSPLLVLSVSPSLPPPSLYLSLPCLHLSYRFLCPKSRILPLQHWCCLLHWSRITVFRFVLQTSEHLQYSLLSFLGSRFYYQLWSTCVCEVYKRVRDHQASILKEILVIYTMYLVFCWQHRNFDQFLATISLRWQNFLHLWRRTQL